mmetsp:Transcript_106890/g.212264  ORF Transcript_106890/g.212264 Transcript_106890/m.212264 type:complete len:201 (-) Transcript_106890:51-653(-)
MPIWDGRRLRGPSAAATCVGAVLLTISLVLIHSWTHNCTGAPALVGLKLADGHQHSMKSSGSNCGRSQSGIRRKFTSISSLDAVGMLLETGEWAYLDIRRRDEQHAVGIPALPDYGEGFHTVTSHKPSFDGYMTFDSDAWLDEVQRIFPDLQQKLIVGCAAGVRSKVAAQVLEDAGYTEVMELDDGFYGWCESGLPVARP